MKLRGLLRPFHSETTSAATAASTAPRRGFMLFRSFTVTMGFYHGILTLVFLALIAVLFKHFLKTFQEVMLTLTAADEEIATMMSAYVNNGLMWLFALVCIYMACTLVLVSLGARHLQTHSPPRDDEQESR